MSEAEPFVRFNCENCGYKSTVSENYSGKNIRCPNCYYIIFISKPDSGGTTQTSGGYSAYDASLLNIQEQNILKHRQRVEYITSEQAPEEEEEPPEETDPAARRKAPWLIDIFLYPLNKSGLKHLALFILVPPLFNILARFLPSVFVYLVLIAGLIVNFLIFLYIYWYLAECVRESAYGWVRAPLGFGGLPTLRDMFEQVVNIIGCLAFFFAPFVLYMLIAQKTDLTFWLLLIWAVSLYPMTLLSVLMHDSERGLNFRKFTKSISHTLFPYCGLILLLVLTVVLISLIPMEITESLPGNCIFRFVIIYAALIGAHLLGRFYWKYQHRLNWDLGSDKK